MQAKSIRVFCFSGSISSRITHSGSVSPITTLAKKSRTAEGALSVETSGGAGRAPASFRLERRGELVAATYLVARRLDLDLDRRRVLRAALPDFLVGLAVTSHSTRAAAGASFDNVTVTNTNVPANVPPHVTLTWPEGGVVALRLSW